MKLLKYILVLLLIVSCKNNTVEKPTKPEKLIPKGKMIDVLYDMAIITAAKGPYKRALQKNGLQPKEYIFEKYNIDSVQFAISNEYYAYNVDVYKDIYEALNNRLNSEKNQYQAVLDSIKKVEDSIKEVEKLDKKTIDLVEDLEEND